MGNFFFNLFHNAVHIGLMHRREARLPIDIHLSVSRESDAQDINYKVKQLVDIKEKAHLSALNNIRNA